MRTLAALPFVLAAAAPAAAADYPATAMLDAFRAGCADLSTVAAAGDAAAAAGWAPVADWRASPLAPMLELGMTGGRAVLDAQGGGDLLPFRLLRRDVAGEELWLVISGVRSGETEVIGCRAFDLAEPRSFPAETVNGWLGRTPRATGGSGFLQYAYAPGLGQGHDTFDVFFVPPESPLASVLQFTGIALRTDVVRTTE